MSDANFLGLENLDGYSVQQKNINVPQGGVNVCTYLFLDSQLIAAAENGEIFDYPGHEKYESFPKWVKAIINSWEE